MTLTGTIAASPHPTKHDRRSTRHGQGRSCLPSAEDLFKVFLHKYGKPGEVGPVPRTRYRFGYYLPADVYEALVANLIFDGCDWIDVGGGHQIFPENPRLAHALARRCSRLVAVDPSENVLRNEFVHERVQRPIEEYETDQRFDVATLRMVAEHVAEPDVVVRALHRLLRPGGIAVVLTVNLWSPVTALSWILPFALHHRIKQLFWGGQEEDTFPVQYLMNTRRTLNRLFSRHGFEELAYQHLDDLSVFGAFKAAGHAELLAWKALNRIGLPYPENCIMGVYEKVEERPCTS